MNKGPRGRGAVGGIPKFSQIDKSVVKRLLTYIFKDYKKQFVLVIFCIIVSSVTSVAGSLFLEVLIDDYIEPMIGVSDPVWTGLFKAIGFMGLVYATGIINTNCFL